MTVCLENDRKYIINEVYRSLTLKYSIHIIKFSIQLYIHKY